MEESNDRKGAPWSDDETLQLLQMIQKKKNDTEIATELQRTSGAIRSRRRVIAADYYFNNKLTVEKIAKFTGITETEVADVINRRKAIEFRRLIKLNKTQNKETSESLVTPTLPDKPNTKRYLRARIDTLEAMLKDMQSKMDLLLARAASPPTAGASPRPA